jgi:hypothetical protein
MSLRTNNQIKNNEIPNWCYDDNLNKNCIGQICSDCPKRTNTVKVSEIE